LFIDKEPPADVGIMIGLLAQLLCEAAYSITRETASDPKDLILRRCDGVYKYTTLNCKMYANTTESLKKRLQTIQAIANSFLPRISQPLFVEEIFKILGSCEIKDLETLKKEIRNIDNTDEVYKRIRGKLKNEHDKLSNEFNKQLELHRRGETSDETLVNLKMENVKYQECIEQVDVFQKYFFTEQDVSYAFISDVTSHREVDASNFKFKLINFDIPSSLLSYYERFENKNVVEIAPKYVERESEEQILAFATKNYTNCIGVFTIFKTSYGIAIVVW
jgi:hypothetical protein